MAATAFPLGSSTLNLDRQTAIRPSPVPVAASVVSPHKGNTADASSKRELSVNKLLEDDSGSVRIKNTLPFKLSCGMQPLNASQSDCYVRCSVDKNHFKYLATAEIVAKDDPKPTLLQMAKKLLGLDSSREKARLTIILDAIPFDASPKEIAQRLNAAASKIQALLQPKDEQNLQDSGSVIFGSNHRSANIESGRLAELLTWYGSDSPYIVKAQDLTIRCGKMAHAAFSNKHPECERVEYKIA